MRSSQSGLSVSTVGKRNWRVTAYAELRDEYLRNLDKHDPEAAGESLDVSGISYRIVQGRIIISTPIGEMSWTSAVKGGFLKVSRR